MSIVTLEFDNTLEKTSIVLPLKSSTQSEAGEDYIDTGLTDKVQTSVFGIQTPLIMINKTVVDFDAIKYFSLNSNNRLPELVLNIEDRYELITNVDKPGNDNEVRVQILPKFDNAYKKIDLTFYITNISVNGKLVRLSCSYKLPAFTSSQFKSFGEIDTYSLMKEVATNTGLGFATNVSKLNDARFVYCDNCSLNELLNNEISYANATEHILDWWVDLWDNINLVDIKERYNAIDSDEDLMIWIAGQTSEVTANNETEPQKIVATINNHPAFKMSELHVKNYFINNNPGIQVALGSDKVYGVYKDDDNDYEDFLIQDGDIKKDIFMNYQYLGENYGDYNYLLSRPLRDAYLQKISADTITVELAHPLLALMRGHRVNFIRYVNDDTVENRLKNLEEDGIIDRNVETNIPLSQYEIKTTPDNGQFVIDKTVSGQYLIWGVNITYNNDSWRYSLTLVKPASTAVSIMNEQ